MIRSSDTDDQIRAALKRLIDHGPAASADQTQLDKLVPPEIQMSWRRSIGSRVDPTGRPRVEDLSTQEELVERTTHRVMDRWYQNLTGTRSTLLFGNATGQIIWRRTLDARDRRELDVAGAVEGSDFSEGAAGTNGLGTSMEARKPVLIRGGQHFLESLQQVACAAAPVIHPLTGRVVGSVSISTHSDDANDFLISLTRQASQEIADGLLEGAHSRDIELARAFRKARQGRRGILVINQDSMMSDLSALPHVDSEMHAQLWDHLVGRLGDGQERHFVLPGKDLRGVVTNVGGSIEPILELVLQPPESSVAPEWHDSIAPDGDSERELSPLPHDADDAVAGWWNALTAAVAASQLTLADIVVPEGSDGPEWVARWSAATGIPTRIHLSGAIPAKAGPTHDLPNFPPLRDRRNGLASLARQVRQGGGPASTFSSEALSAMLAWTWPGDIAELQEVVNALPVATADRPTVEITDLPPYLASGPSRELTRWEQKERDALLEALFEADGVKSTAAAMLGIGRTTLYRKLRSLSITEAQIGIQLSRRHRRFPDDANGALPRPT